jgi:NB-ARC domain
VYSDYVTQQWRFAYSEAAKCVNPIVRLDGTDGVAKPVDGYDLIPEDLRLLHAEDFRRDEEYLIHLENLVRQLREPMTPAGKLVAVPELPPHYLEQPDRLKQLRDILLVDLRKPVVVSGAVGRVGLHGMGGIGKSVLACALAHHPDVRRAFPDGVYWVSLGQQPKLDDLKRQLARQLGDAGSFGDVESGEEKLRELMKERAALLVLHDVWTRDASEAFNVARTAAADHAGRRPRHRPGCPRESLQVQFLSEDEARALLASAAGVRLTRCHWKRPE